MSPSDRTWSSKRASKIGARTVIEAFCFLGRGSRLGEDCRLHPRVTLYAGSGLGNRVELHSGAVIGGDGFGYVFGEGRHMKFPQIGTVEIGDDVEIGANTTIDRGSLEATRHRQRREDRQSGSSRPQRADWRTLGSRRADGHFRKQHSRQACSGRRTSRNWRPRTHRGRRDRRRPGGSSAGQDRSSGADRVGNALAPARKIQGTTRVVRALAGTRRTRSPSSKKGSRAAECAQRTRDSSPSRARSVFPFSSSVRRRFVPAGAIRR